MFWLVTAAVGAGLVLGQEMTCAGGGACGDPEPDQTQLMQLRQATRSSKAQGGDLGAPALLPTASLDFAEDACERFGGRKASTPKQYKQFFDGNQTACVSPRLFGNVISQTKAVSVKQVTSGGGLVAFVSMSTDLEVILEFRAAAAMSVQSNELDAATAASRVSAAIANLVGFSRSFIVGGFSHESLVVFDMPACIRPKVPTFEGFFEFLNLNTFPGIPLEQQLNLTLAYDPLQGHLPRTPVQSFARAAACNETKLSHFSEGFRVPPNNETPVIKSITQAGCSPQFDTAYNILEEALKQRRFGRGCADAFFENVNTRFALGADTLRAFIFVCFGASELFASNGFGFDTVKNSVSGLNGFDTSLVGGFTGREFVIPPLSIANVSNSKLSIFPQGNESVSFMPLADIPAIFDVGPAFFSFLDPSGPPYFPGAKTFPADAISLATPLK